jgi:leukotriene-A4 hydrolase
MERVLLQVLYSPAERGFSYIIGRKGLQDDLKGYTDRPKYQRLVIDFEVGEDPDDAYSQVPYDKGANFILYLGMCQTVIGDRIEALIIRPAERTLGGLDSFLPYVRNYVNTFMGQSITTFQWKDHLLQYWEKNGSAEQKADLAKVDFDVRIEWSLKMNHSLNSAMHRLGSLVKVLSYRSMSSMTKPLLPSHMF